MNCAYHIQNVATVQCNGCGKPLCAACDHRVKGFPYCQDCIVEGVDLLRNQTQSKNYTPFVKKRTSPFVAAFLSMAIPGLGAAYNGQTVKALVYFAVFVGLFQMAVLTGGTAIFVFGFIGMWFFAALDAWRTAQMIRSGLTPDVAEDIFVKRFSGNPKLWGILLTLLGTTFLLQMAFGRDFSRLMNFLLPVFLIGLGLYILRNYIFKSDSGAASEADFSRRAETPSFISAMSDARYESENFDSNSDYPTQVRAKSWKNRR